MTKADYQKKWRIKNKDRINAANRQWWKDHPGQKQSSGKVKARAFIEAYKKRPCLDCQGWFNPWQLEFDHLPQFPKFMEISEMMMRGMAIESIVDEIKKCELICSNCHADRTHKRRKPLVALSKWTTNAQGDTQNG